MDLEYTEDYKYKCPVDASAVTHTVTYKRGSCSRYPEDVMISFVCSRNSACVKCSQNYID